MALRNNYSPIIGDIQKEYNDYRAAGKSRADAVHAIKADYAAELRDEEDGAAVMIGLSLSLCRKRELTKEIALETLCAIETARKLLDAGDKRIPYLSEMESLFQDESMFGEEAKYKIRTAYAPDWQVGDTFSHTLTVPRAEKLGILGWSILLYMVGEYTDRAGISHQLMYAALCPPGKEPASGPELQALGFLRMMPHDGDKWDYLVQLTIKNKKDMLAYGLSKIGNFPDVAPPADRTDENPLVAMPFFGFARKGCSWPGYEDQICQLYREFGKRG